ncbi:MAG: 30S ribosomal protein S12 methylthiotransferase RimO [bacterium]
MIKVGMISLGCAKNLVDAEIMLGHLRQAGMTLVSQTGEADAVIVNTCAFVDAAKRESIETILRLRQTSRAKIIMAGCMAQRFAVALAPEMKEVDAFVGLDKVTEIAVVIRNVLENTAARTYLTPRSSYVPDFDTPRLRLTPRHYAYVKIAEGCSHGCSFCAIPQIRGKYRSRSIASVVKEARQLVKDGVKELLLVSQDTTFFGKDKRNGETVSRLLEKLQQIKGDFWIRLLYTHPAHWSEELIRTMGRCSKVARYVDMPVQHIHDGMLTKMRRGTSGQYIKNLIARIRAGIPGVALRTSLIVGFPGETEAHFEQLLEFVKETRFDRLGVFAYSKEEGTRAAKMEGQVPPAVAQKRLRQIMRLQQKISLERNKAMIGKKVRVLTEGGLYGRTEADAPDVDGRVMLARTQKAGKFREVSIRSCDAYDLFE